MTNNATIITMITLWTIFCLITGIFSIIILAVIILILLVYLVAITVLNPIKTLRQRNKDKKEVKEIYKQRIITTDNTNEIIREDDKTEDYYISKIEPKYVYYHNKLNDAITILDRDTGKLWMIQPSNRNDEYYKYKLKYEKFCLAIEKIEKKLIQNKNYLDNEGILLTKDYYHENKLPGNFT